MDLINRDHRVRAQRREALQGRSHSGAGPGILPGRNAVRGRPKAGPGRRRGDDPPPRARRAGGTASTRAATAKGTSPRCARRWAAHGHYQITTESIGMYDSDESGSPWFQERQAGGGLDRAARDRSPLESDAKRPLGPPRLLPGTSASPRRSSPSTARTPTGSHAGCRPASSTGARPPCSFVGGRYTLRPPTLATPTELVADDRELRRSSSATSWSAPSARARRGAAFSPGSWAATSAAGFENNLALAGTGASPEGTTAPSWRHRRRRSPARAAHRGCDRVCAYRLGIVRPTDVRVNATGRRRGDAPEAGGR